MTVDKTTIVDIAALHADSMFTLRVAKDGTSYLFVTSTTDPVPVLASLRAVIAELEALEAKTAGAGDRQTREGEARGEAHARPGGCDSRQGVVPPSPPPGGAP